MADGEGPVATWFPVDKNSWGLDVVTLLAVIGESSMEDHAQPITASVLCLLPRILPAPQALLKSRRPTRLPTYNAQMVGVYNGVALDSVGFFANIIHPLDDHVPYSFRVIEIKHTDEVFGIGKPPRRGSWAGRLWKRSVGKSAPRKQVLDRPPSELDADDKKARDGTTKGVKFDVDVEKGSHAPPEPTMGIKRRRTAKEKVTDFIANPTLTPTTRPAVPPAWSSPIHIATVASFVLTMLIFGLTAYWKDGNALIAIFIISTQASLVGYASWWRPRLMVRPPHSTNVPPGDMMIRTREGAFILVKCTEEVARELYTGTEDCEYHVGDKTYRFLMALGTMLLMVGVVLLGNTRFEAQVLISGSYIILNGAYWLLGMLPRKYFWDLSRYKWEDITPADAKNADKMVVGADGVEGFPSFTRTLWYAIRETKHTGWVERSGAAPSTSQWRQWLKEAGENAHKNRKWPSVSRKDEIMRENVNGPNFSPGGPEADSAAQHAPLREVQPNPEPVKTGQL
ncbi:hypothetical protein J7T55_000684 [Diaporthe amygdali]|uniref:uncharacterized protein n=1 Tax=Phomopsis amygdali TaxID=1214568 RepID=UPI0022FEF63C|nr:uncharacterized protein J7T55_000684 [Diaporthe amygdali]KAJ0110251.1 hypothetical protein J7T55_000684 [Diaporthe amygdali]